MKLFLSSAEGSLNQKVLLSVDKRKNVLVSFYYMKNKTDKVIIELLESFKQAGNNIFLDSGAHSFLNEILGARKGIAQKKLTKTKETPEEYFELYLKFLKKFHTYFDILVELDIDAIVGYRKVLEWRDRIIGVGIPKGKLVVVYHPTIPNWEKEWERWCKEGYYVGIGSFPSMAIQNYLFKLAIKYKSRVHGFAMTRTAYMIKYPWASVDSSSWNIGQRFGGLIYFDLNSKSKLKTFSFSSLKRDTRAIRKFELEVFPKISSYLDFNFSEMLKNNRLSTNIDVCNIYAYLEYEKYIERVWKARGFDFTYS